MYRSLLFAGCSLLAIASCSPPTQETKPIRKDVTETVFASGKLLSEDYYQLSAETDGVLTTLVAREGDDVKAGQWLGAIANTENELRTEGAQRQLELARANTNAAAPALQQALANIESARAQLVQDSAQWARYDRLVRTGSVARSDAEAARLRYEQSQLSLRSAEENLRQRRREAQQTVASTETDAQVNRVVEARSALRAPAAGRVYRRLKEPGTFVRRGDVIAEIGSASRIYAEVQVDETSIGRVQAGQPAQVRLNTDNRRVYAAVVDHIDPAFSDATQTFTVRLRFVEVPGFTVVGTQLQANIEVAVHRQALLIPRNFLDPGGRVQLKGKKEPVTVRTGFVSSDWVQVLLGLDTNSVLSTTNLQGSKQNVSELGAQMQGQ